MGREQEYAEVLQCGDLHAEMVEENDATFILSRWSNHRALKGGRKKKPLQQQKKGQK